MSVTTQPTPPPEPRHDDEDAAAREPSPIRGISRNVFVLSLVSLCTDVAGEMIYPLVPLFLTGVLGAPATVVGLIEGLAEATVNLLKLVSGRVTDRRGGRRGWVFAGYGLSALAKPLLALATVWPLVLLARVVDRVGKGTRGTPRDALIAASSDPATRGRAFGFHRSTDTFGAVIGPLAGVSLLAVTAQNFRLVFLLATAPALIGVSLIGRVREPAPRRAPALSHAGSARPVAFTYRDAPRAYRTFLGIGLLFALGNSSDTFLILRAHALGLGDVAAVLAYAVYNLVYAAAGWPAGILSDRRGRRGILVAGFLLFALVYGGLGLATGALVVWPLFALYGLYIALTDGVTKAYITDLVPAEQRGGALGLYAATTGLMALVSSLLAGVLWDRLAPAAPFYLGGLTALLAAGALVVLAPQPGTSMHLR
jgi:MFS family permease